MKTVIITGCECIFDRLDKTFSLTVRKYYGGYKVLVFTNGPNKGKSFARVKLNLTGSYEVDHINGNPLDNRECNLRRCTRQQNMFNVPARLNKKSNLPKGVYKSRDKFVARIKHKCTNYNLGTYVTVEQAEAVYKAKAEKLQGEYTAHLSRGDMI